MPAVIKEPGRYAFRKANGFPTSCITLPPHTHAKLAVLSEAWKLPKSTVIAKLIMLANPASPPEET
jgi:hypothetical protein